ncbi:MAG: RNA polymerase sigma factor RpoH [Burkholderiaceae bacterium]
MTALTNTAFLPVAGSANAMALPAVGNIEAYISAAHRVPMLTPEREQALARRLRDHDDLDAAREMVMSHLRLVVSISRQYLGYGLPHADLIQEGSIGLMKAVKRFDPDRGVRLVSFAMHWIKAEIHEFVLRNWRLVKVATTKAQRKLFFNLRSMKTSPGTLSPDEVETIAQDLNVKTSDVIEMETRLGGQDVALDKPADDEEGGYSPISYLVAPEAQPDVALEAREHDQLQSEGIKEALMSLDDRSRRIVQSRWLRDEDDGGSVTLQELANEYGVSAERIRQIEAKALKTMREALVQYQ